MSTQTNQHDTSPTDRADLTSVLIKAPTWSVQQIEAYITMTDRDTEHFFTDPSNPASTRLITLRLLFRLQQELRAALIPGEVTSPLIEEINAIFRRPIVIVARVATTLVLGGAPQISERLGHDVPLQVPANIAAALGIPSAR